MRPSVMSVMRNAMMPPATEEGAHIEREVQRKRWVRLGAHKPGGVELAASSVLKQAPAHHMKKWVALECPI